MRPFGQVTAVMQRQAGGGRDYLGVHRAVAGGPPAGFRRLAHRGGDLEKRACSANPSWVWAHICGYPNFIQTNSQYFISLGAHADQSS